MKVRRTGFRVEMMTSGAVGIMRVIEIPEGKGVETEGKNIESRTLKGAFV